MNLLNDKIAVVTGAISGIGWAIVSTFVEHGAHVIVVGVDEPPPPGSSRSASYAYLLSTGSFTYLCGDVSAPTTLKRVADVAEDACGHIDVLINNEENLDVVPPVGHETGRDFESDRQINPLRIGRLSAHLLPLMRSAPYGRIINIGSIFLRSTPHSGPHDVSKHPLLALTRSQALEYGRMGITANCLLSGGVNNDVFRRSGTDGEFRRYIESKCPLARLADAREIAAIALFLASPLSSYINGHFLLADGGLTVSITG